jgi:hypothetical protein
MEIVVQKYEIEQGGKTYNISTQAYKGKLRIICEETNVEQPLAYYAEFTLSDLAQLCSLFTTISSISEAQDIFENIVINQKIEVESQGEYLYLKVGLKKEGMEEYFSILLNLYDKNAVNNKSSSYQQNFTNIGNIQSINYDSMMQNTGQNLAQQYLSLISNNKDNGQFVYSTKEQYNSEFPTQTETTQNMTYNITGNNYGNNYSYENVQSYKTKRRTVDKLTLSLRAQQTDTSEQQIASEPLSPQSPEQFIQDSSPLYQKKIVETVTTTTNVNNEELENLRNENNKLNILITQLKTKIEILEQENNNLKLRNANLIKNASNGNDSQEIKILKEEIENYIKEIRILKDELNKYEQYKMVKEQEIHNLKMKIEELLINQKKIEQINLQKQKEIDELRAFIDELIRKQKLDKSQYQSLLRQKEQSQTNLEDQMLTIQDTRLEIVKGDIIQDVKELELLSRKISKNNRKIVLNLLYKATIDSDKAEVFHQKCDNAKSTLVLVKSDNGKRFGGFTTRDWKGNSIEKKDNNAFVFSLDKMKIYDIILGEDAIGCYPKYGPVFLGCQIRIYDEFFSQGGSTFEKGMNYSTEEDYELTGGLKKFGVKELEVYSIELE